jgi:hypothetical protein
MAGAAAAAATAAEGLEVVAGSTLLAAVVTPAEATMIPLAQAAAAEAAAAFGCSRIGVGAR